VAKVQVLANMFAGGLKVYDSLGSNADMFGAASSPNSVQAGWLLSNAKQTHKFHHVRKCYNAAGEKQETLRIARHQKPQS